MEINLDKDNLEKALGNLNTSKNQEKECKCHSGEKCKCENGEEIGYHKGALNTLLAERNELVKILGNVEMIMGAHIKRLQELGVEFKKDNNDCN